MEVKRGGFYIYSKNVVLGDKVAPAAVHVLNGKIEGITTKEEADKSGLIVTNFGTLTVMPGIVDSHVHVNEPGRTDWEGFESATHAACAGGVTTIVDMPLNSSPVTTTLEALEAKILAMKDKLWVDVALLGGVIPGNSKELLKMVARGVVGFKCFMIHSGIDEFPAVTEKDIQEALDELGKIESPVVLMFHAEVEGPIASCSALCGKLPANDYFTFLKSRPKEAEDLAIQSVINLCSNYGKNKIPCHIVHLSSGSSVDQLRTAKKGGVIITCETTYHYLSFVAEQVPPGNTLFKCCPPIRELSNREILWKALQEGVISCVVSDHSPCTVNLKNLDTGNFLSAWGGIASLQLGLSIVWTEASLRGWTIPAMAKKLCLETAKLVQLSDRKGSIEVGKDADFVVWDPETEFVVTQDLLYMKNKSCPYLDKKLKGKVIATYLHGEKIFEDNQFVNDRPTGQWVKHNIKFKKAKI